MNSGSFHVMSQGWRYFSREKSIVHTLHLAELAPMVTGQSVFITSVPPTGTSGGGFNVPPNPFPPITPYGGINWTKITLNVPLYWVLSAGPAGFTNQSGTYGFTGTFGPFDTNKTNNTFEWSMTGGSFLAFGGQDACADNSSVMDTMKAVLFYSNQDQVPQTEFHEGQYFIRMVGGDWNNQFYVQESAGGFEPMDTSAIIQGVPPYNSIGIRNSTSDIVSEAGCSFFGVRLVVIRLGPS